MHDTVKEKTLIPFDITEGKVIKCKKPESLMKLSVNCIDLNITLDVHLSDFKETLLNSSVYFFAKTYKSSEEISLDYKDYRKVEEIVDTPWYENEEDFYDILVSLSEEVETMELSYKSIMRESAALKKSIYEIKDLIRDLEMTKMYGGVQ